MAKLFEVNVTPESLQRFEPIVGAVRLQETERIAAEARDRHAGRSTWNVNSTAVGGGVAEMLPSLLGYARGLGLDARWLVIEGTAEFFEITKRLHHALHGSAGDGSPLDEAQRAVYELVLRENAREMLQLVRPGDVVILHDPQTAGLAPHLRGIGAHLIWRCHIGQDEVNTEVERGWAFLAPYLAQVGVHIFSRAAYVPAASRHAFVAIVAPSIDPFSPKNRTLEPATSIAILEAAGLIAGETRAVDVPHAPVTWRVERRADVIREGNPPPADTPLIVQVSRWDPLKDPVGVMQGYAALVNGHAPGGTHLVLAGPEVTAVTDDPESATVLESVIEAWRALPEGARRRIHLAMLPTADLVENALIVNALQQHAAVVVQKSLHEGFGLTVTEAMWKARPMVASAVGGIQDQIEHGVHGLLVGDPTNIDAFSEALNRVIEDRPLASTLGAAARERVRADYLAIRHLTQYAQLLEHVAAKAA